jgi:hypothetical protein
MLLTRAFSRGLPTLYLDFLSSESADSRLTISGGAGGTRVNSSGNIVSASAPRFDYDPVSLAARGLLVEEQRTNLYTWSAALDNAAWAKTNSSVTADQAVAPDGGTNADKLIVNNGLTGYVITTGASHTSGTTYTHSVFVKPAGRTTFTLLAQSNLFSDATNRVFNYTLTGSGSVASGGGTGATATIIAWPNGWYLCTMTYTPSVTVSSGVQMRDNTAGDGTSGFYLWGAQLEAGSFATSYIPTTTAQVIRTADSVTMTGAAFSSWFNATQGTLYGEADIAAVPPAGRVVAMLTDATVTNAIDIRFRPASLGGIVTGTAGFSTGAYTPNAVQKMAIAFAANDFAFSPNGAAPATLTGTLPTGMDRLFIADPSIGQLNGHLRKLRFYPQRLPNAQLQVLTQ